MFVTNIVAFLNMTYTGRGVRTSDPVAKLASIMMYHAPQIYKARLNECSGICGLSMGTRNQ